MADEIITVRLTAEEREVHIWLDDIDRKWKAEVSIGKYITKFTNAGWSVISTQRYEDGQIASVIFEAPECGISIRKPIKREMSEEQREAARIRMIEMAKNRNS